VISVDENYMFTVTDTVANTSAAPITLAPYGSVQRQGVPRDPGPQRRGARGRHRLDRRQAPAVKYAKWQKDGGRPDRLDRRLDRDHRPLLAGRPDPGRRSRSRPATA
jgi:hypothetical protein